MRRQGRGLSRRQHGGGGSQPGAVLLCGHQARRAGLQHQRIRSPPNPLPPLLSLCRLGHLAVCSAAAAAEHEPFFALFTPLCVRAWGGGGGACRNCTAAAHRTCPECGGGCTQVLRHHGVKVAIINPAYINSSMTAVRTDVKVCRQAFPPPLRPSCTPLNGTDCSFSASCHA